MTEPHTEGFMRHIRACNTATLPGQRLPLRINGALAGYVDPDVVPALKELGLKKLGLKELGLTEDSASGGLSLSDPARLESIGEELARRGLYRTHNELFDVWGDDGQPPLGRIDRGALPLFGFIGVGVHLNGLVRKEDGLHLWIGRRARDKRLDPGKLDHLVAGGVPAGLTPDAAILKEAEEEASLPPDLVQRDAKKVGLLHYALERPEGLRRDRLVCYDLFLAESFQPMPADGEVEEFLLLPIGEVFRLVRDTDEFKFNVNLVLIDLFLRIGLIDPQSEEGGRLRRGLQGDIH